MWKLRKSVMLTKMHNGKKIHQGKGLWKKLWTMWKTWDFQQLFCGFALGKGNCIKQCILAVPWDGGCVMFPAHPGKISMEIRPKSWIPGKIAQKSLGTFRGTGKIFVKKHQIRHRMISPPKEILSLKEITGGRLCPEK